MERIKEVWFNNNRIWMKDASGKIYSRPLEAFPVLMFASDSQRNNFSIELDGTALRWKDLDEDIHITSFYEEKEPQPNNEMADLFRQFPQLSPLAIADAMGIHYSLLNKYIYGMQTPSQKRKEELMGTLHSLGSQLLNVRV